ncbi:MAG: hypothetical protein SPJ34_00165 [Candidatus Ornithospirochaeta sp.]|nr:hypothetical protein [Candidatus Ornithospirochaeta sp.]
MKGKLSIIVSFLMVIALLASCAPEAPAPEKDVIKIGKTTYESLAKAVEAAVDGDTITVAEGSYAIDGAIEIAKKISIKGAGSDKTEFTVADGVACDVFTIKAADVSVEGISIKATSGEHHAFAVNANGFAFKNSSITGDFSNLEEKDTDPIMMGIAIAAGTEGTVIEGAVFTDCYTPVYASSASFTIKDSKWNSGIEIDQLPTDATVIKGNSTLDVEEYKGKINFINAETSQEAVAAFVEANPGITFRIAGKTVIALSNSKAYTSIQPAIDDAPEKAKEATVIKLLTSVSSGSSFGFTDAMASSGRNIVLDLNGNTYAFESPAMGSVGYETQAMHLSKGNALTVKNGTLEISAKTTSMKMFIQNYCDLTLDSVTVDGTNIYGSGKSYTISNNNGTVVIKDSKVIAKNASGFAFDVCRYSSYDGPSVKVTGKSEIKGNIGISCSGEKEGAVHELIIEGGFIDGEIKSDDSKHDKCPDFKSTITGGTFTSDPSAYVDTNKYAVIEDAEAKTWTVKAK